MTRVLAPALRPRRLFRNDGEVELRGAAQHRERSTRADARVGQDAVQVVDAGYRLAVEGDDQISLLKPGALRRAVRFQRDNQDGAVVRQTVEAHYAPVQRHVLPGHADEGARDLPVLDQAAGDELHGVYGHGETDPLRRQDHGRVDADDVARGVDERPARVPRVQSRVGLDDVVDEPARAGAQGASEGAHDTGRDGALEAVRVADGDDHLARADRSRFP